MFKSKNILFAVIISAVLIFAHSALAARTVPGQVPILQPLQPPPENAKPNVSGNIQSGNPQAPSGADQQSPLNDNQDSQPGEQEIASPFPISASSHATTSWVFAALIAVLLGAGLGYWLHIRKK